MTAAPGVRELLAGRDAKILVAAILVATVGQGMVLPYLFVYLTHVRHLDPTVAGLVAAWVGLAGLLFAGPSGSLVDRFGARAVFLLLIAIYAAGVGAYAFVRSPWPAFAAATLASAGGAPLLGAYNTLLSSAVEVERQQRFFGLAFATLNVGLGLGAFIGGAVTDVHHPATFQLLYLLDGAALLLSGLLVLGLHRLGARGSSDDARPVTARGYRAVLGDVTFRRFLTLGFVLMSCAYAQFEFGLPAFAINVLHVSTRVIGWSFAAGSVTIVLVQFLALRLIDGRRRTSVLAAVGIVLAASWLLLGLGALGRSSVGSGVAVASVAGCAVVFAFGEVLMSPVLPALTNALATDAHRGRYNALSSMLFGMTAVVGPITAAPLIGHGLATLWIIVVVAGSLVAGGMAVRLGRTLTREQNGVARIAG